MTRFPEADIIAKRLKSPVLLMFPSINGIVLTEIKIV